MADDSDSSEDFYFRPQSRRQYNPKPHLVVICKADSGMFL